MKHHILALALVSTTITTTTTLAQTPPAYPQQPIKLLTGFAAGGPTDLVARAFADSAAKGLGQPVVVENKPGANALLATEAVAAAKPDGHTLLAAATNHTMLPALYGGRMKADAARGFQPVCTLASSATVLVVGPGLPAKTLADFLAQARARPGGASFGSPGLGSSPHLATESLRQRSGLNLVHVPYKGAAPAVTDLIGGQIDLMMATVGSVLPHIQAGKLVALAVAAPARSALLPQVPTFDEAGLKGLVVDTWYGLLAPAGTPAPVLATLERQVADFHKNAQVRERLLAAGLEPSHSCGAAFGAQITREITANARLAQDLGLKAD